MNGKTKKWRMGQPMPKPLAGHCAIRDWDAIYVIGSADANLEVFIFNITKQSWNTLKISNGAPTARQDFACALSDNKEMIYITGGNLTKNGTIVNECYTFDIHTNIWSPMSSHLFTPRSGHIMTKYQNLTTIVGGVNIYGNVLVTMESLKNETWTILEYKLTNGRKNFGVTRVPTYLLPSN